MTEEQREALRALFQQDFPSRFEAAVAVAKLVGCAVVPTREIMWFEPGGNPRRIAKLEEQNGVFRWIECPDEGSDRINE